MKINIEEQTINQFASNAHEEWRKGFDSVYAGTGIPAKQRIKKNSDGTEGDINVPFEELHLDWKKENLAAGKAAIEALRKFPNNIEDAADFVHQQWMKRNPKEEWNASQHISYSELSPEEKNKDRVQVVIVHEIMSSLISKSIQNTRNNFTEKPNNSSKINTI
jgi:hypothetical protein